MKKFLFLAALSVPLGASAQLTVGAAGLTVQGGGAMLTTDGLTLQPAVTLTLSNCSITRSATPVTGASGTTSIARVYTFSSPIPFSGAVSLRYNDNELGSNAEAGLRLAYSAATTQPGSSWTTGTTSTVNTTTNVVSQTVSSVVFGRISATSGATPLPVSLLSFTGRASGSTNRLDWSTAAESGVRAYAIERSNDGSVFAAIGMVTARGGNETYQFYDREPSGPLQYYRLRVEEATGETSISATVLVRNGGPEGGVTVAPVPARDYLNVTSTAAALENTSAAVVNLQGVTMVRFPLSASQRIDVSNWPSGVYFLKLANGVAVRLTKH